MRRTLVTALSAAALSAAAAALPAAAVAEAVRPLGSTLPLGDERLSDDFRLTRCASAAYLTDVRKEPGYRAAAVGRLRLQTEDGPPEIYLVLRSHVDDRQRIWLQIRVPRRPNGTIGWVPRDALGELRYVRTHLRINRRTLRATLYKAGRRIWSSRIGIGARRTPTPGGRFYIRERLRGLGDGTLYGPWAFGTSAYSVLSDWPGGGIVGIHGTNQPHLIPGRPSHGCVRVPNARIRRLARIMPIGTPVRII